MVIIKLYIVNIKLKKLSQILNVYNIICVIYTNIYKDNTKEIDQRKETYKKITIILVF